MELIIAMLEALIEFEKDNQGREEVINSLYLQLEEVKRDE